MKNFCQTLERNRLASRRDGVTLVELLAVVTILGIMAAVATPRYFDAMEQYKAEAAAKRVRSDMELAQRTARLTSTTCKVSFTTSNSSYKVSGARDPDHPSAVHHVILTDTGYAATLVSANFGSTAIVTFDRYGRPDNGGTVVVQAGSYQKTISVDATTGQATIL